MNMFKRLRRWFKKFKCSFNSVCCKTRIECEVDENGNKIPPNKVKIVNFLKEYE